MPPRKNPNSAVSPPKTPRVRPVQSLAALRDQQPMSPSRRPQTPNPSQQKALYSPRSRPQTPILERPSSPAPTSPRTGSPVRSPRPKSAMSYSPSSGGLNQGNVKVAVRVRPFLQRELDQSEQCLISMEGQSTTIIPPQLASLGSGKLTAKRTVEPKEFIFDESLWSLNPQDRHFCGQQAVYEKVGKEFVDHNIEGYHTCILAYGQTGSGKSYTMMGDEENPGIIPRTCEDLFARLNDMISSDVSCTVRISYFEVYNEQVHDLLAPPSQRASKLKVRESPTEGPYVEDLSEFTVQNVTQVMRYMKEGNKARATASTKMNDQSSRSHAVFTLVVKQMHVDAGTDSTEEKVSRIRLVDLAGSERANSSGATGERLREGSNINRSLTTLGRVIAALASSNISPGSPSKQVVPYRDSVLTWLLKDSLGGNSKTAMIACISPTDYEETVSTLRYADQAKKIRLRAVINQDIVSAADRDRQVEEMQERINTLQMTLSQYSTTKENEEDKFKSELEKVRHAIRFYEERAINEENKRKAIQAENEAYIRHNRLLKEHLREITNKNPTAIDTTTFASYESLKNERDELLGDIKEYRSKVQGYYSDFAQQLMDLGINHPAVLT
ncbi:hypothetical protein TRVA0_006S02806 [Trichomonascus vanleenenianus]|uniref:uncharacterized protein n=1 Tax=Trichomonascus vanleenenianus TaxID=2268995 RepID=UPI003ECAA44A